MPHVFYSVRMLAMHLLLLTCMLPCSSLLLHTCKLLYGDPVDLSCLWLIDVRPLMRVSAPGVRLLATLLLYTVNPSCLLHFRPLPPALCFYELFPPQLLCRISLAGRVPCGIAATFAGVPPKDHAAVASEMEGGIKAGTIGLSDRPGVRPLIQTIESGNSGESWTIDIKSPHACWPYLPSFRRPTTSH